MSNVTIDSQLLAEAQRVGGHRTKKATVTEALYKYIQHRKQAKIPELFGTIESIGSTTIRNSDGSKRAFELP